MMILEPERSSSSATSICLRCSNRHLLQLRGIFGGDLGLDVEIAAQLCHAGPRDNAISSSPKPRAPSLKGTLVILMPSGVTMNIDPRASGPLGLMSRRPTLAARAAPRGRRLAQRAKPEGGIRCLGCSRSRLSHGARREQQRACRQGQNESAELSSSARCGFAHRRLHSVLRFAAPEIRRVLSEAHAHACFESEGCQQ